MSRKDKSSLRTVVFIDWSPISAILLRALDEVGHRIDAIIVHEGDPGMAREKRWGFIPGGQWSPRLAIERHAKDAVFLTCRPSEGWTAIAATLHGLRPDLLVCYAFLTKIPPEILSIPRYGAVNFHPARLPQFRGSAPLFHLVLQNREEQDGGVTLHEMTERMDAGAIIAFARLPASAWRDVPSSAAAIAGAVDRLAREVLPKWIEGTVQAAEQDAGAARWAGLGGGPIELDPGMDYARLVRLLAYSQRRPGLCVTDGRNRLAVRGRAIRIGRPTGMPPRAWFRGVTFDCADARVWVVRPGPFGRLAARVHKSRKWRKAKPIPPVEIIIGQG